MTYEEAVRYCGYSSPEAARLSGLGQFVLLLKEGLRSGISVLEIGSGCFAAGTYLADYVTRYVGIEPNEEVSNAIGYPIEHVSDFRSKSGEKFDFILSHSVLSHVSDSQLPEFMRAVGDQLAPGGVCLASIRLNFEQHCDDWVYPDPRMFSWEQVLDAAGGLKVERRPDYRDTMISFEPNQVHDWIRVTI